MSTLRRQIADAAELQNPNVTKVVVDADGFAMYFSRAPIPFTRSGQPAAAAWAHVGLYVYRRETLLRLAALPQTPLERAEALEQLRALEHGIRIKAVKTTSHTIGVDTQEDLERVRALLAQTITT
jgi:3-deoxy-manno-octulosonate cytidylyltransferase (CMP-KDO synthetase)